VRCQQVTCCSVRSARALMSSRVRQPEAYQRRQVASAAPHTFRNCTTHTTWFLCYRKDVQPLLGYHTISASLTHAQRQCWSMLTKAARLTSGCDAATAAKRLLLCSQNVCLRTRPVTALICNVVTLLAQPVQIGHYRHAYQLNDLLLLIICQHLILAQCACFHDLQNLLLAAGSHAQLSHI